jgi:hypothetical protein
MRRAVKQQRLFVSDSRAYAHSGGNILVISPLTEPMAKNYETATVKVEVELADPSQEPDGPFESLIKIRIAGTDRHACQMVKEAVLLGIQTAFGDEFDEQSDEPVVLKH